MAIAIQRNVVLVGPVLPVVVVVERRAAAIGSTTVPTVVADQRFVRVPLEKIKKNKKG